MKNNSIFFHQITHSDTVMEPDFDLNSLEMIKSSYGFRAASYNNDFVDKQKSQTNPFRQDANRATLFTYLQICFYASFPVIVVT